MTVGELIEILQDYNVDLEVRIAYQPNHPLQSSITNALTIKESLSPDEKDDFEEDDGGVVYVVSGKPSGYATSSLWR